VTVFEVINLPDQPAIGSIRYQPMGGDGWESPKARYEINVQLAGDVSGQIWLVSCVLDPQFMNLVALMALTVDVASDTTEFSMDTKLSEGGSTYRVAGDLLQATQDNSSRLWTPPPMIDPVSINFRLLNVDGVIGTCDATVYLFNKSAQHVVPIEQIFQCLPRASSMN